MWAVRVAMLVVFLVWGFFYGFNNPDIPNDQLAQRIGGGSFLPIFLLVVAGVVWGIHRLRGRSRPYLHVVTHPAVTGALMFIVFLATLGRAHK